MSSIWELYCNNDVTHIGCAILNDDKKNTALKESICDICGWKYYSTKEEHNGNGNHMDLICKQGDNAFLYLGNRSNVQSIQQITINKIDTIVCMAGELKDRPYIHTIQYKLYDLNDTSYEFAIPDFIDAVLFIDRQMKNNKRLLIHCQAGRSRSASVVILYIMLIKRMTYHNAYQYVKSLHIDTEPNNGYVRQLLCLELALGLSDDGSKISNIIGCYLT